MKIRKFTAVLLLVSVGIIQSGCAALIDALEAPSISLDGLELVDGSLQSQKFALTLGVSNGNPIPLPIAALNYALSLNGQSFINGQSDEAFTVPANGATSFKLEVTTDLLSSARSLSSLITGGGSSLKYDLSGSVALDIPATSPLAFSQNGEVVLDR